MDDLAAIADAAVAGVGVAWLPSWLVRKRIEEGELVSVAFPGRSYSYHNHALWQRTDPEDSHCPGSSGS
jgi:DNA-binding transcriptional LysR family regulator